MIVFVEDIPQKGIFVNRDFEIDPDDIVEDIEFVEPVSVEVSIKKKDEKVLVKGTVKTVMKLVCSRCLEKYEENIDSSFDLVFMPEESFEFDEEIELSDEDINVIYFKEGFIDVDQVVIDQLNLSLPFRPLCSDNCKGLCPVCGKNLNEGLCGCEIRSGNNGLKIFDILLRGRKNGSTQKKNIKS